MIFPSNHAGVSVAVRAMHPRRDARSYAPYAARGETVVGVGVLTWVSGNSTCYVTLLDEIERRESTHRSGLKTAPAESPHAGESE